MSKGDFRPISGCGVTFCITRAEYETMASVYYYQNRSLTLSQGCVSFWLIKFDFQITNFGMIKLDGIENMESRWSA